MKNANENKNDLLREGKDFLKYLITIGVMSIAFLAGFSLLPVSESIPMTIKAPVAILTSALLYVANEARQRRNQ